MIDSESLEPSSKGEHRMATASKMTDKATGARTAMERSLHLEKGSNSNVAVVGALSEFLASTYVLYQKSLFYHWNVTGPNFVSLHELFEQHYEDLHKAGDEIAERIRALGHFTPGTMQEFTTHSRVKEDTRLPGSAEEMVKNLLADHEGCSRQADDVLKKADESGDDVTVDMMVERMGFHDKAAWMLRSILGK